VGAVKPRLLLSKQQIGYNISLFDVSRLKFFLLFCAALLEN